MEIFNKDYYIGIGEVDCALQCKPYFILHFLQDAATLHSEMLGFSRDQMIEKCGGVFILTKLFYRLDKPVSYKQTLTVKTWHRGLERLLWYRDFQLFADGQPVGVASSAWVLLNPETKRILRPREFENLNFPCADRFENKLEIPKITHDMTGADKTNLTVQYSQIDINNHVNNTKYIEICQDALNPADFADMYVSEAVINYQKELRYGENFDVYALREVDTVHFSAQNTENKFEARVRFEKL